MGSDGVLIAGLRLDQDREAAFSLGGSGMFDRWVGGGGESSSTVAESIFQG